jgi:hypothetical protein
MAAITQVFTISWAAKVLGESEDCVNEISIALEPEERRLTVCDLAEDRATDFTRFGIGNLAELVQLYKSHPNPLPPLPKWPCSGPDRMLSIYLHFTTDQSLRTDRKDTPHEHPGRSMGDL